MNDPAAPAVRLLLDAGVSVVLPPDHLCCGYPLLASGCRDQFERMGKENQKVLENLIRQAETAGFAVKAVENAEMMDKACRSLGEFVREAKSQRSQQIHLFATSAAQLHTADLFANFTDLPPNHVGSDGKDPSARVAAAAGRRTGAGTEDTGWSDCRRTQPRASERSLV